MATPVARFLIEAKDDTAKGIGSAIQGMEKLGASAAKAALGTIAKMAGIGLSIAGVTSAIQKSLSAFGEQEKAQTRLAISAKNNPLLTQQSYQNLLSFASAMQKTTTISKDQIYQMEALLAAQGKSETQIKAIIKAATDMSAVTGDQLESSVVKLSKTFSGMAGELGEINPAIKNLTKEQLQAGKAIEIVAAQYSGAASAIAQGVSGQIDQIKNMFNETLANFGAALAPVAKNIMTGIKPALDNVANWLAEHKNQITNFFLHFPEMAKVALEWIRDALAHLFTGEHLAKSAQALWQFVFDAAKNILFLIWDLIKALAITIWEPLKLGFEWVGYAIKTAWRAVVDALVVAINFLLIPVNKVLEGLGSIVDLAKQAGAAIQSFFEHPFNKEERQKRMQELISDQMPTVMPQLQVGQTQWSKLDKPEMTIEEWNKIGDAWKKVGQDVGTTLKDAWADFKKVASAVGEPFAETFKQYKAKFEAILGKPLPIELQSSAEGIDVNLKDDSVKALADAIQKAISNPLAEALKNVKSELFKVVEEDIGGGIKQTKIQGIGAAGFDPMTMILSTLMQFASSIASISMLLNPFQTILEAMFEILTPVINDLLGPLVGILVIVGQVLGKVIAPILKLLAPLIEWIAMGFVLLYNFAIMPLANAIIFVINVIHNMVAYIWNAIASALNALLGWAGVKLKKMAVVSLTEGFLTPISTEDVENTGDQAVGEQQGGGGGAGASYTGQRPISIYVTNEFQPWSVVGTPQESFYDEIRRNLGLIEAMNTGAA